MNEINETTCMVALISMAVLAMVCIEALIKIRSLTYQVRDLKKELKRQATNQGDSASK